MGYLTTITFRNDDFDVFQRHPEQTLKVIKDAQQGVQKRQGRNYDPVGNCCNPVILQKPRHADDSTLYFHWGNTVMDVEEIRDDRIIDACLQEMEYRMKQLKKRKEALNEKTD